MSLSPLVSFQSRFVTHLLNFPRINYRGLYIENYHLIVSRQTVLTLDNYTAKIYVNACPNTSSRLFSPYDILHIVAGLYCGIT